MSSSKVAIITGATNGIGRDLAHYLHGQGYKVGLAGRNVEKGEELVKSLDASGESAIFVKTNVTSYEEQGVLFKTVWEKWQRLDVLIANAGTVDAFSPYSLTRRNEPVSSLPPAPDLTCTETNYKGPIFGTVLAAHFMRHNPTPGGKIIITSSTMAVQPCATFPEYSSTKAAHVAWTRSSAPVLKEKENITINVVMPNAYDTGIIPGFAAMFLPHHMITKERLLEAYDVSLKDEKNEKTGLIIETGHEQLYFHEQGPLLSGEMGERNRAVFEPLFQMLHGENSNLKEAVKGLPNRETNEWR